MSPEQHQHQSSPVPPTPHAPQLEGVSLLLSIALRNVHGVPLDRLSANTVHFRAYHHLQAVHTRTDFCPREWPEYPLTLGGLDSYLTWENGEGIVTQTYVSKGVFTPAELAQIKDEVTAAYHQASQGTKVGARLLNATMRTVTRTRETLSVSVQKAGNQEEQCSAL
ncbi:hypothetical protein [Burkholderia cenocepacia]|uniref:hypothetical protein n=1 Tax=Burkholderia cenocepacia TaxID=95486 RepID=UPI00076131E3|nr:hypothetical protein [Burkholderia cenocepacia]KWU24792.1 hypothetical protein AS149_32110 [Burkholderia cenocepacia]